MTSVVAGPYELIKDSKESFEKISFCLMDDNCITQRHYNRYGNVMTQRKITNTDLDAALI